MKHLIMGTAGHVDHGKTSLIKALTNIDCDTHKEEKARGITINLGFSHIDLPSGNSVGIIDVPGHKDFINTMVGGACGIDFVLLVIAADSGIMPQTTEHFNIIKTLHVKNAIIALNKIDLVDEELAELAKLEIMEWLEDTDYQDAPIVGVSSTTGQGLDELIAEIDRMIPKIEEKEKGQFFRMYIDRIFTVKGIGSVVTGSVLNGEINVGDDLFLLPGHKQKLRIRNIERHGQTVKKVVSGDRAALNLTGLKADDFKRGMLLSNKEMDTTQMIDAQISLFDNADSIKLWSSVIFHSGTFESQARIHLLNKDLVSAGEDAIVQIHLEKEGILLNKDQFIVRNTSGNKSYGGGVVIDNQPLHHRKRTSKLLESLELLASGVLNEANTGELIKIELKKEGKPMFAEDLANRLHISFEDLSAEIENVEDVIRFSKDGQMVLVLKAVNEKFIEEIINEIAAFHEKNSIIMQGIEEIEFYGKFGFSKNKAGKIYLGFLLRNMEDAQQIKMYQNTWILPDYKVNVDDQTKENIQWLEKMILDYQLQKPSFSELKKAAHERRISMDKLKLYISYLTHKGLLFHHKDEFLHTQVLNRLRKEVLQFLDADDEGFYLAEVREATGLTKKLAPLMMSILEEEGLITTIDHNKNSFNSKITEKGKQLLSSDN